VARFSRERRARGAAGGLAPRCDGADLRLARVL